MAETPNAETLGFDLDLDYGSFRLSMAETLPLEGVTAITGPSGSGKTSLLRALAGLVPEAVGEVRLGDTLFQGKGTFLPPHARGIGYVFQEARLFPHMSVSDNLHYGARRRGVGEARLAEIISALDLAPLLDRPPTGLSGGEARRVSLGRTLASGPRVLFLDEPLTGLDGARKAEILPYLARATVGFGLPALLVSHAEDETLSLADRILRVSEGRLAGWAPDPLRLSARVASVSGREAVLELGEARLRLVLDTTPGALWSLAIPRDGALLSERDPGAGSALASLPAEVLANGPGGGVRLRVAGQVLTWPDPGQGGFVPTPGDTCWLSLLRLHPRPMFDS